MTIEHAVVRAHHKPWGCSHLLPWSHTPANNDPIGDLWFARLDATAPERPLPLGSTNVSVGRAVFLDADPAEIVAGADGMKALLAYPGPNLNSGALCERRPTVAEHPRLITQEMQTWPR